jgi:starch phosphorylase
LRKIPAHGEPLLSARLANGVAALHSQLPRSTAFKDFSELFPERCSKTNGVTPRRWLLLANRAFQLITDAIGDSG